MSDETTDPIAAIVREAMDYAADHGRITTPEDYADRIREALATPAADEGVRERVDEIVMDAIEACHRADGSLAGSGEYTDRILALLRTPSGEGERGLIMRAMLETFPWSPDIRQGHFERAADAVIAALRSEAPGEERAEDIARRIARDCRALYDRTPDEDIEMREALAGMVEGIEVRLASMPRAARRGEGGGE